VAMIRRLLIANRGEIAVRIARTCRRLGIETVAVYSDADRRALHVESCDLGRRIGPPQATRSYLEGNALLAAARVAGAEAIHPGYGFLSENADFAAACRDAGFVFVGPSPAAIRAMGSKERSRALAAELGVPLVPGVGAGGDDASLAREARRLGFPLLVKASAGGGGKGIRIVEGARDLDAALDVARREAASAFGDATLIIERYVQHARHIEVQVVGDRHGARAHLYDRECSLQRNHQKLIEEAPAPRLPDATRGGLRQAALRIADAIGYESVGTVEFLVDDATGEYFFLEMNTRLQVEHPTTELVTGVDLVELQIRVACGEPLPPGLGEDEPRGVAIEARICAERPEQGFVPATGTVRRFAVPAIDGVRLDAGIAAGSVVTAYYDSLLAKVIAHGRDRDEARAKLSVALTRTTLAGVDSNLDFLTDLVETPAFRSAAVSTRFVESEFLAAPRPRDEASTRIDRLAAAVAWIDRLERASRDSVPAPWDRLGPWRVTGRARLGGWTEVHLREADADTTVIRVTSAAGRYQVEAPSGIVAVEPWWSAVGDLHLELEGALHKRSVDIDGENVWLSGGGRHRRFTVVSREARVAAREAGLADPRNLLAPFPGLVTNVEVAAGDRVEKGGLLVVMEAMKMVHSLRASGAGAVRSVHCRPGRTVTAGDLLVEFEGTGP
jgi:3-methylcrotonyl-CoA carboxylase alpha subunit